MTEASIEGSIITPERMAKGDLQVVLNSKKEVIYAIPRELTIIKDLIHRRIFPHHYEIYGTTMLDLRAAFRSECTIRSAALILFQWGIGTSEEKARQMYLNVVRIMGIGRIDVVEYTMDKIERRKRQQVLGTGKKDRRIDRIEMYEKIYEKLVVTMDEERERMKNENNL